MSLEVVMNINSAHYGYLITERQKRRFYRIKKLEKMVYWFYKIGFNKTYFFLDKKVISFGKWYIQ